MHWSNHPQEKSCTCWKEDLQQIVEYGFSSRFAQLCQEPHLTEVDLLWGFREAVFHSRLAMVKWWLDCYALRFPRCMEGDLLHLATTGVGNIDLLRFLVTAGCDLRYRDAQGKTPLHRAAWLGKSEICQVFLESGACPNEQDANGWRALHWAIRGGHESAAIILIKAGANPHAMDQAGISCIQMAQLQNNEKMWPIFKSFLERRILEEGLPEEMGMVADPRRL